MGKPEYLWRKLTPNQRIELLDWRKRQGLPWHRPPHRASEKTRYHVTAACFEHRSIIGHNAERMASFSHTLLDVLRQRETQIHAWCVLPNHYHALIETPGILEVLADLGRMHGRLSFQWNGEEQTRGRQVWCGAVERFMRNDAHFWATMNYVHHNPVHHGYVGHWQDWPFSSAADYLSGMGREEASRIWKEFPVLKYGKGWDDPEM
ncbi:MAG TPA: transposase [Verrucomicrobiae bacterium]|nr:transposase [Verrucomicrobiae bacterium]